MKDLTKVGNIEVITREKAKITPEMTIPGPVGSVIRTVDIVLLADETTVFQCVHPDGGDCVYTADNVNSITAHQRAHGPKAIAKAAQARAKEATAELETVREKQAKTFQNRSAGAKKAHVTRQARRAAAPRPTEIGGRSGKTDAAVGDEDLAKAAQRVITAWNALQECTNEFQNVFIGYMRMAQTASVPPAIDPQILAKARQYDELKKRLFDV